MRHYHLNKAALWRPVINVDKLPVRCGAKLEGGSKC